jgi:hypothetical protein
MRPGPPSFSLAKTKIMSPLATCFPPYIVFCAVNVNVRARGSLTAALIANVIFGSVIKELQAASGVAEPA